jgi:CheY-like chemotaxis protein/anti-sigma regulatory factor (Ser/Thr protein kinase)
MPERALGRLAILHDAGKAMYTLVEDVLDIAMLDSGKVRLATAPFDLRALLATLADHWQVEADTKQLGFAADLASCPGMIEGDARRITQIVGHLLSNAVKFTPSGTVSLGVAVDGGEIEIAVADTGIGIPADQHALVFEKFHQVDAGTARRFGGVGIGLAVARNLAAAMDGSVALESAPGDGAIFRFRMPLREAAAPSRAPANGVRLADASVLLVEPNRLAQSVTLHGLRPLAAAVDAVADLDAAHTRLALGGIHHLIVQADAAARMAEPLEALRMLAAAASRAGALTTIVFAPADFAEADLQAIGAARLLAKPVALPALAAALAPDEAAPVEAVRAA